MLCSTGRHIQCVDLAVVCVLATSWPVESHFKFVASAFKWHYSLYFNRFIPFKMFPQMKEELKRQAESACFKARPNNVIHKEPFVPRKENRSILGMLCLWWMVFVILPLCCTVSSLNFPWVCWLCVFWYWSAELTPKTTLASFQLSLLHHCSHLYLTASPGPLCSHLALS